MARTTGAAVQAILLNEYDVRRTPSLDPFIETASALIDQVASKAIDRGTPVTDSLLELLERWVAAHCYTCADPSYTSKQTQNAIGYFMGANGKRLEGSRYGQMALALDPTGILAALGNAQPMQAFWLGKRPSEQTDYVDRR